MKSRVLMLVAALTFSTSAMSEQVPQGESEQIGQSSSQATTAQEQPAPTPAQLIAQDFQTLAKDHATVGSATSNRDR